MHYETIKEAWHNMQTINEGEGNLLTKDLVFETLNESKGNCSLSKDESYHETTFNILGGVTYSKEDNLEEVFNLRIKLGSTSIVLIISCNDMETGIMIKQYNLKKGNNIVKDLKLS